MVDSSSSELTGLTRKLSAPLSTASLMLPASDLALSNITGIWFSCGFCFSLRVKATPSIPSTIITPDTMMSGSGFMASMLPNDSSALEYAVTLR